MLFRSAIERATTLGGVVESPEMKLRCRDGSDRLVLGHMTLVGGDMVISWSDLTAIRQGEVALRESEGRFRGMMEQMVSGFYVAQGGRFVYVNPALARMAGQARDAMLGRDPLDLIAEASRAAVRDAQNRLTADLRNTSCRAHLTQRNGAETIVDLQLSRGVWDREPALFAVVEDITERARSEEKAADYLRRLENAMQGTLHAVSRMVDLRDPYTAGHERRVGLLCSAIARELGWQERRCRSMEMIGLIHDIEDGRKPMAFETFATLIAACETANHEHPL